MTRAYRPVTNSKPEQINANRYCRLDKLRVGDFAVAVGNPFGLGQPPPLALFPH